MLSLAMQLPYLHEGVQRRSWGHVAFPSLKPLQVSMQVLAASCEQVFAMTGKEGLYSILYKK